MPRKNPEIVAYPSETFGRMLLEYSPGEEAGLEELSAREVVATYAIDGHPVPVDIIDRARAEMAALSSMQTDPSVREEMESLVKNLDYLSQNARAKARSNPAQATRLSKQLGRQKRGKTKRGASAASRQSKVAKKVHRARVSSALAKINPSKKQQKYIKSLSEEFKLGTLPPRYREMWIDTYESAKEFYGEKDRSARVAWAQVKKYCTKIGKKWTCKNPASLESALKEGRQRKARSAASKAARGESAAKRVKSAKTRKVLSAISNPLPGGLAEGMAPSDFDPEQLQVGTQVEMEHTGDPSIAQEIAMDHLIEDPEYYIKLATIERH